MTTHNQNDQVQTLTINQPLNDEGNMTSIGPVSGLMAMAKDRGFNVDIHLHNPFEEKKWLDEFKVQVGEAVIDWFLDCDNEIMPPEVIRGSDAEFPFPEAFHDEIVDLLQHGGFKVTEDKELDEVLSEEPKPSMATVDGVPVNFTVDEQPIQRINAVRIPEEASKPEPMPSIMEFIKDGNGTPLSETLGSKMPLPETRHGFTKVYPDNECMTTAQVARCLFGSGSVYSQKPLYRKEWRDMLGSFQFGKACKVSWPRVNVKAYKADPAAYRARWLQEKKQGH